MANWVNWTTTSAGGNVSLQIAGGYANVSRSGNTVTGNLGLRFNFNGSWSSNSVVGVYGGTKYFAQNRTGGSGSHANVGDTIYCKANQGNGYNTTETLPWSFSTTVSGDGAGTLTITMSAGWTDWAGSAPYTYTFSVPYPQIPERTVSLYVNKENVDGTFAGATKWKDITVNYNGSYSQTWSATGYDSVTFSESNVTTNHSVTKEAYRTKYYLDLNGYLDSSDTETISGYGTCNLSFNDGSATEYGITDHHVQHRYGTTYTFSEITPTIGHTYLGVQSGSLSGTITGGTETRLSFCTNDVFANCNINQPGDVYIKVNGTWVRATGLYVKRNGEWVSLHG